MLVKAQHDSSGRGDASHEELKAHSPSVDAGGGGGTEHGNEADVLSREDEGDVGSHSEERVVLLRLVDGGDGVGETPEEEGDDDGSPHLSHEVEEGETPVPEDAEGGGEATGQDLGEGVAECVGVDDVGVGVKDQGEGRKEGKEGEHDGAEDVLLGHLVCHLGVDDGEGDGARKVDVGLEEGDHLGTTVGDHNDVLGITEDGVVKRVAEEDLAWGVGGVGGGAREGRKNVRFGKGEVGEDKRTDVATIQLTNPRGINFFLSLAGGIVFLIFCQKEMEASDPSARVVS